MHIDSTLTLVEEICEEARKGHAVLPTNLVADLLFAAKAIVDHMRDGLESWDVFLGDHGELTLPRRVSDEAVLDGLRFVGAATGRPVHSGEIAAHLLECHNHSERILVGLTLRRLSECGRAKRVPPKRPSHDTNSWLCA